MACALRLARNSRKVLGGFAAVYSEDDQRGQASKGGNERWRKNTMDVHDRVIGWILSILLGERDMMRGIL